MINRLLVLAVLLVFTPFAYTDPDAAVLQSEADHALAEGDIETALGNLVTLVELQPGNTQVLELAASLASELGMVELAADLWIKRANLAVNQADKNGAVQAHAEISDLHRDFPIWVGQRLSEAQRYSQEQVEAVEVWEMMSSEAAGLVQAGELENAVAAQESALLVAMETFGESHWLTVSANRDLGVIYFQLGLVDEAENFYMAALMGAEAILGESHPETLEINQLIAGLYSAMGFVEESRLMMETVSAGFEASLGTGHALSINARRNEIEILQMANLFDQALAPLQGLCASIELSHGKYHPQMTDCLGGVASLQLTLGDLDGAESSYRQIVDRLTVSLPDINSEVLNALTQLAEVYRIQGRYEESKTLLSSVIHTALLMGEVEASFSARTYLGRVLNNEGEFVKAQLLTEDVLRHRRQYWQHDRLSIYNIMLELGAIYQRMGKLPEATTLFEEARTGLMETFGSSHPSTLVASNNLGQIYEQNGLYDRAEPLIKQTLLNMEITLGEDHPDTLNTRNNLGLLHESQGNFREAEPLYLKSLKVMKRVRGENHNDTIAVKNNLAYLYMLMESYEKSASMFVEVQQQWQELFGENHQNSLKATNNLGRIYHRLDRLSEAEQQIQRALELRQSALGPRHIDSIRSMIDLGGVFIDQLRYDDAEKILSAALGLAESELGKLHPYTFDALNYLAQAREKQDQLQAAVDLREIGFNRRSEFLDIMLWTTGDNAREGYIRLHRPEFNKYMSLLVRLDAESAGRRVIDASLQRKGLLLKVTSEIQQIATMTDDPELKLLAIELQSSRKKLAAMTLSGPTAETKGRHPEVLYELERQVNELQGEIGRASVRFRTSIARISSEKLAAMIEPGTSLVDFLVFEENNEKKLLAAVVSNQDGEIKYDLVNYGAGSGVDEIVVEYRTIIQDDLADEDELLEIGMLAYETVWEPLNEALRDSEYVYLIPDGILNILPFNALIDADENYLIETHDLHTLTSGRDLLPSEYRLVEGEYLVIAGPDYDSQDVVSSEAVTVAKGRRSAALKMGIRAAGSGLRGLSFSPLPGAAKEGQIIVDQFIKSAVKSQKYFGVSAQEQVLGNMTSPPEVLHIATHGFFLEEDDTLRRRILKAQRSLEILVPPPGDNPLLRAGLAFAGINANAQFLGDIDTANDGILTALEVLDLNLSGTKLVILSACETGLGEIHEGEGVYGLRRSFQEAGVAEVISSLWEVSDAGTQALMTDFYEQLLKGVPAREALRQVQLDLMDSPEWGYPYVWSAFMIVGSYESAGFNVQ